MSTFTDYLSNGGRIEVAQRMAVKMCFRPIHGVECGLRCVFAQFIG